MPIYLPPNLVRAPTKTLAFTGAANLGAVGSPITIWTLTGRVLLVYGTAFCTETVVSTANTGTIALGTASRTLGFVGASTMGASSLATNEWWAEGAMIAGAQGDWVSGANQVTLNVAGLSESIIITVATNAITDGTLVFDCFYIPLTAGAGLA